MLSTMRLASHARNLPARNILPHFRPCLRTLPAQWLAQNGRRYEGTVAPAAKPRPTTPSPSGYVFKDKIDVFLGTTLKTATSGIVRLTSVGLWLYGTAVMVPSILLNETPSVPWALATFVGSSIPMIAVMALSGPYIASVGLNLPPTARKSKEHLKHFVANISPATKLDIKYLRFAPWLQKTTVKFRDLRRIPPKGRYPSLVNLEYIPGHIEDDLIKGGIYAWFLRRYFGRFWLDLPSDRSHVPGMMETLYRKIPPVGTPKDEQREWRRRAPDVPNRPVTDAAPVAPPMPRVKNTVTKLKPPKPRK